MPDDRIDTPTLTAIIDACFDLSMNGDVAPAQQDAFLAAGKRLRGYLVNLVSARFQARTAELVAANAAIADVDRTLRAELQKVRDAADAVKKVAELVAKLDEALVAASKFV